jgi:alkylhydroperoxidase family enzyme
MNLRLKPLEPPYESLVEEDFRALMPPGMAPLLLFRTLAHNPRVLRRIRRGGLLDPGSITVRQRELVILRTTALARAEYEWGVHVAFFGATAGFDATALHATVWGAADAPCWSAEEVALLRACDELHARAQLDERTWEALCRHFTAAQRIEVLVLAGLYRTIAYVVNGAGVPLEPSAPRFPPE